MTAAAQVQAGAGTDAAAASQADGWQARLSLRYRQADHAAAAAQAVRTVAQDLHQGPLRVLRPLYPEGPGICHHVIVHPPGGVVGGDQLRVDVDVGAGAHAVITTPGATRFYRSDGRPSLQQASLHVAPGGRLEWLPMEAIAYSGCQASNAVLMELDTGAEMIGWDVLALGLPAAQQPFATGWFRQQLRMHGQWLEQARIRADDALLLASPLGAGGHGVLATAWCCRGGGWPAPQRTALLDAARDAIAPHALAATAGATSPQAGVVLVRVLGPRVEAVMQLLAAVRAAWRQQAWGCAAEPPRIWRT